MKESFQKNVAVHFQSRDNFNKMVKDLKDRASNYSIDKVTHRVNNWLERVNDWAFGIDTRKK